MIVRYFLCNILGNLLHEENRKPEDETKTEETVEYTEEKKEDGAKDEKEPEKTTIFYVTDEVQQSQIFAINVLEEDIIIHLI